jgi:hypothetical protein
MQPGEGQLHLGLDTSNAMATRQADARAARYSSKAVLPTPDSPRTTSVWLWPARTASTSRSSIPHSARRPVSPAACRHTGKSPGTFAFTLSA